MKYTLNISILLILAIFILMNINNSDQNIINKEAKFGPRDHGSLFFYQKNLFLMGGAYKDNFIYQDYWFSENKGKTWKLIYGHDDQKNNNLKKKQSSKYPSGMARVISFKGKIYAVDNHIWKLDDGYNWKKIQEINRVHSADTHLLEINERLFAIDTYLNTIFQIDTDKKEIKKIDSFFNKNTGSVGFSFDEKIFISGGEINKIWYSKDGNKWNRFYTNSVNSLNNPFMNRLWPCLVKDDNGSLFLFGGYNHISRENMGDLWFTKDMKEWKLLSNKLIPLHAPMCVYDQHNHEIIVAGGKGFKKNNDKAHYSNLVFSIKIKKILNRNLN